jgi:general secretion pathway protein I
MSCRTERSEAGFTLIEVLVSIAVLAVVLGAIGSLVGTTVRGIRSVDRRLPLLETAQGLVASLPDRNALQPGTETGGSGDYRWRIDVVPLAAPAPANALPALTTATTATAESTTAAPTPPKWTPLAITVRVQSRDGGPPVRLDTVRLVPVPAKAAR